MTDQHIELDPRSAEYGWKLFHNLPRRVRELVELEAENVGTAPSEIMIRSHRPVVTHARFRIWARLRSDTNRGNPPSFPRIGRWFDRDHTTVMFGVRRAGELDG